MNNAGLKSIFSFYRRKSTLIVLFIIFVVFYAIFDLIIRKTYIHNKLFNKSIVKKHKYVKFIFILLFISFVFSIEYGKQLLKYIYDEHNYLSIIVSAFLSSIYANFIPIIFRRNK